jgi:hypothetical protein
MPRWLFWCRAGLVLATVSLAACDQATVCTTEFVYGLTMLVTDSGTQAPLGGPETVVVVRDGAYVDSVRSPTHTFLAAGERPGVYSVLAKRGGYQDWTRTEIQVRDFGCHVSSLVLNVRLQPLP